MKVQYIDVFISVKLLTLHLMAKYACIEFFFCCSRMLCINAVVSSVQVCRNTATLMLTLFVTKLCKFMLLQLMPGEMYEYSLWCKAKAQARVKEKHTTSNTTTSATANTDTAINEDYDNSDNNDNNADALLVDDVDTDDYDSNAESVHNSDDNSHDTAATAATSSASNKRQRTDNTTAITSTTNSSSGGIVIDEDTAIAYSREGSQVSNRIDLRRVSATYNIHTYMCS
jgi:hypothetical protein